MRPGRRQSIFVEVNTALVHGRKLLEGIADYAHVQAVPWALAYHPELPAGQALRARGCHGDGDAALRVAEIIEKTVSEKKPDLFKWPQTLLFVVLLPARCFTGFYSDFAPIVDDSD
jgi:hypothetical protein